MNLLKKLKLSLLIPKENHEEARKILKRDPNWYEDHQKGCPFGQPELDDYCKDCECDEGWFAQ